jgi:hypothetical protein
LSGPHHNKTALLYSFCTKAGELHFATNRLVEVKVNGIRSVEAAAARKVYERMLREAREAFEEYQKYEGA